MFHLACYNVYPFYSSNTIDAYKKSTAAGNQQHVKSEAALRDAAIGHLGGIYRAAAPIAPGVTMLDALMARLLVIGRGDRPERRAGLGSDAAFIAKWCGAFFDHGMTAMPLPNRDLGLYRAVLAMAAYDPDYRTLTGARGAALLLSVPRDPLEAISESLASLEAEVDPLAYLSGLVARLPGWAGHIRWRSEHADPDRVADAPATMADLVALWILLARADALSAPLGAPSAGKDRRAALLAHFGLTAKALGPRNAQRLDIVARVDDDRLGALFMTAAERSYANGLIPALQKAARTSNPPARPPSGELWKQKAIMKPSAMPDFSVYPSRCIPSLVPIAPACCRCFSRPVTTFRSVRFPAAKARLRQSLTGRVAMPAPPICSRLRKLGLRRPLLPQRRPDRLPLP